MKALLLGALTLLSGPAFAQGDALEAKWRPLVESKDYSGAKLLCGGWLTGKTPIEIVEGHKCLAAVGLAAGEFDKALEQLNAAAELAPHDVSIHGGRLHLLIEAKKFAELPAYLEKSIAAVPTKDGLEAWLTYSGELQELERYEEGLAYCRILEKHFSKDHRVIGNLGAYLAVLNHNAEALKYAKRAVELSPNDPINNWNLGRLYDTVDKADLADRYYRAAIKLERDPEERQEHDCLYAEFLKIRDRPNAEAYEHQHCPGGVPDDD